MPRSETRSGFQIRLKTEALLISGGNTRNHNYHSHLVHIRRLTKILLDSGIPPQSIAIFASALPAGESGWPTTTGLPASWS